MCRCTEGCDHADECSRDAVEEGYQAGLAASDKRVRELTEEVDRLRRMLSWPSKDGRQAVSEAVNARIEELEEALRGLVAWADDLRRQNPEEDLRRARLALSHTKEGENA